MADDYQTICLQCADAVATLTLNRPQRLNAINKQMLAELQHALETIERDPDVRALVVNGAGGNFSSGFDLSEQMEARPSGVEVWRKSLSATSIPSRGSGISASQPSRPLAVIVWQEAANWHFAVTSR